MTIEVEWSRMTGPEVRALAARNNAMAILPLGSLEQHGPHLPVIVDTQIAIEVSRRAAQLVADEMPIAVLPGLWTGISEHHLPFGGTISLNFSELRGVLTGIVRSLKVLGFSRLLIINHHGGNIDPLAVACRELCAEFGIPVVSTLPWFIDRMRIAAMLDSNIIETTGNVGHACEAETSIMMLVTPELVRTEKMEEAVRQSPAGIVPRAGFSRFWSFSELEPVTGVMGDPTTSTPEKGEQLCQALAEMVADGIRDQTLWRTPDPVWTPGRGQGNTAGAAYE